MSEKRNIPYIISDQFIFRIPGKNIESLSAAVDNGMLHVALNDSYFLEALYIASPDLYQQLERYRAGDVNDSASLKRLEIAIYKYYSRLCTRCTPFGLFAGVSLGRFEEHTKFEISSKHRRLTRLDMDYVCSVYLELLNSRDFVGSLKFYPNTSLYQVGNQYRYVEFKYVRSRRVHRIISVQKSYYLETVLECASRGGFVQELAQALVDSEITIDDSLEFIYELIESQILVSEIDPNVTGESYFNILFEKIQAVGKSNELVSRLSKVNENIARIDSSYESSIPVYKAIEEQIAATNVKFKSNQLLQTDLFVEAVDAGIELDFKNNLFDLLCLFKRISSPSGEANLSHFKQVFTERYEDAVIPLAHALDIEVGIGYPVIAGAGDVNPLVDDVVIPSKDSSKSITVNAYYHFITEIYQEYLKTSSHIIQITDELLDMHFPKMEDWGDLPDSMIMSCKLVEADDANGIKVYTSFCGGTSAGNLLGRFCCVSPSVFEFTKHICDCEQELNRDKILAEIVHLPESRTGNILLRPHLRAYEIPYLAGSTLSSDYIVAVSDILVTVKGGKVVLRSKRLDKEILPRLTTAHNYSYNSQPIYHFLCDLQSQGKRSFLGFTWNHLNNASDFLPRIEYKNYIVSPATWFIKKEELAEIVKQKDVSKRMSLFTNFRKVRNIPGEVILTEGDNDLYLNLEQELCLETLIALVKGKSMLILVEFLFSKRHYLVKDKRGSYTNEFQFVFLKKN